MDEMERMLAMTVSIEPSARKATRSVADRRKAFAALAGKDIGCAEHGRMPAYVACVYCRDRIRRAARVVAPLYLGEEYIGEVLQ
jgi:hypothetical protein